MNHSIQKGRKSLGSASTIKRMNSHLGFRAHVALLEKLVGASVSFQRIYRVLEERGLDMLLLIVPCVFALLIM